MQRRPAHRQRSPALSDPPPTDEPWLRRQDQLSIAGLTALALVSIAGWWIAEGGPSGRLINIERAAPVDYRFMVDINSAEWPELAQLPEVGEVLARRIVEHRQEFGDFQRPEDLTRVRGIGDKTLQRVRGFLLPLPGELTADAAVDDRAAIN